MLISFANTLKLICAFVFAYAIIPFSHDDAHMILTLPFEIRTNFCEKENKSEYSTCFDFSLYNELSMCNGIDKLS